MNTSTGTRTLKGTGIYEQRYLDAFSQRTVRAAIYMSLVCVLLQVALAMTAGRSDWLSIGFLVRNGLFGSVPWLVLMLARLRRLPLGNFGDGHEGASPRTGMDSLSSLRPLVSLLPLPVWIYCCWSFVKNYAVAYAPSLLLYYTYPEGKYGPPLIREQPFYLHSFALWYGLTTYWLVAPSGPGLRYWIDGRPPGLVELILRRIRSLGPRLGRAMAWAAGALCLENLFGAPLTLLAYTALVGTLHPLRRPVHPFGGHLLSPPLWWHLAWMALGAGCLLLACDVFIEHCFGRCFHLCRGVPDSNGVLVGGLKSDRPMVRQQALLELRHLLLNEPFWRESLYREFLGEEALSRLIGRIFVEHLRQFAEHLGHLNDDLRTFSAAFEAAAVTIVTGSVSSDGAKDRSEIPSSTFASSSVLLAAATGGRTKGILTRLLERLTGMGTSSRSESGSMATAASTTSSTLSARPTEGRGPPGGASNAEYLPAHAQGKRIIPDVLEITRRRPGGGEERLREPQSSQSLPLGTTTINAAAGGDPRARSSLTTASVLPRNKYLQLTLLLLRPFASTGQAQAYAALACERIKAHWGLAAGGGEEALLWLLQALCALITTSYDEDVHGQVQFALNDLLGALLAVWSALETFSTWPRLRGQPLGRHWLGGAPLPTERRANHLLGAIEGVLEMISVKFADSLDQLKLEVGIRERLARILA